MTGTEIWNKKQHNPHCKEICRFLLVTNSFRIRILAKVHVSLYPGNLCWIPSLNWQMVYIFTWDATFLCMQPKDMNLIVISVVFTLTISVCIHMHKWEIGMRHDVFCVLFLQPCIYALHTVHRGNWSYQTYDWHLVMFSLKFYLHVSYFYYCFTTKYPPNAFCLKKTIVQDRMVIKSAGCDWRFDVGTVSFSLENWYQISNWLEVCDRNDGISTSILGV